MSGTLAGGEGRCEFAAVAVGRYAISAIHDVDGNGRLDTGWFGIPTEPWAVSRDAPARFGPARFDDARFDYRGGLLELTIKAQ